MPEEFTIEEQESIYQLFRTIMIDEINFVMQVKKGHVWVNMFVDMLPHKLRSFWMGLVLFVEAVITAALCYGSVAQALSLIENGCASDVLNMPWWPFAFVCAFGFLEFFVLLIIDSAQSFIDIGKKPEKVAE